MIPRRLIRPGMLVLVLLAAALARPAAAAADAASREGVKATLEELSVRAREVNRAYRPFRRGAPADTAAWSGLDALQDATGSLAATASRLRGQVEALRDDAAFAPTVGGGEFRRRLAAADSLIAAAARRAASPWRGDWPDDPEDAAAWIVREAAATKQLADRTAAAAGDVAYAVGVTEGVGPRTLNLSLVGIVVVFAVLALIALVVGAIRKLDDGWQVREAAADEAALTRDPTIDETTVVLIAAACATVITGRHRVRRIRRLLSPRQKRTPWSAQGRLILQGSHTVDRKSN